MASELVEDEIFEKLNFKEKPLEKGSYEYCQFTNCDFYTADLSEINFVECSFTGCNLSLARLDKTVFRDVQFRECKMLGLRFYECNEYGRTFSFDNCQLNQSSFYQSKIRKTS